MSFCVSFYVLENCWKDYTPLIEDTPTIFVKPITSSHTQSDIVVTHAVKCYIFIFISHHRSASAAVAVLGGGHVTLSAEALRRVELDLNICLLF